MQTFISYSSIDRDRVKMLVDDLQALGQTVWFDRELARTGGQKWWGNILLNIRKCDLFVFVLTPTSLASEACQREYRYAHALNKRIFPIMLSAVEMLTLPPELQELQILSYTEGSKQQGFALAASLNALPAECPMPDPLPTPPEAPLSPMNRLAAELEKPSLTGDEQIKLVFVLEALLTDLAAHVSAENMLRKLYQREDTTRHVADRIRMLIPDLDGQRPSPTAQKTDSPFGGITEQTLHGYQLHELIGSGGYGEVYRASQPSVGRDVAIKVIRPEHADQPEFSQRFDSEAQIVARLEHPHIIPLYDYWRNENGAFIVMRWLQGGSLAQVLSRQGALSLVQTARVLDQIADALAVTHQLGVIHRDLKPANILLDERGNAYLTDFGLAKALNSDLKITGSGDAVGTPMYMAPEQLRAEPLTPQADIYNLGIILYEMLTGAHPFADTPGMMVVMKHLEAPVPTIHNLRPTLPDAIDAVIQRATAKEPTARYATAPDLAAAFRAAITALPALSEGTPGPIREGVASPQPIAQTPATPEGRNRYRMLQNVRAFWITGVLDNSLHGAALLELGMREQINKVNNPWEVLLRTTGLSDETLAPGMHILDIFDKLNGKLLILGDPGGGKTTTLLELARDLLSRAERDDRHPIPVILNLSSWSEQARPLADWLIDELSSKYQAPRKVAQTWVAEDGLLLLLDGLDEVPAERREACVMAINAYRKDHGFVDVVVCSRILDYQALTNQLSLNGAVLLQPLSEAQVDAYFASFGSQMGTVRAMLAEDETLREMSHSPLILSIMVLAYQGVTVEDLPKLDNLEAWRKHLFDVYVRRMFERRLGEKAYSQAQTTHYLAWLAGKMKEHAQSIFLIEKMQPTWLTDDQRQRFKTEVYWAIIPALMVLYGVAYSSALPSMGIPPWAAGVAGLLTGGALGWFFSTRGWTRLAAPVWAATAMGVAHGFAVGIGYGYTSGVIFGIFLFIVCTTVLVMSRPLARQFLGDDQTITVVEKLYFSHRRVSVSRAIVALIFGVFLMYALSTVSILSKLGATSAGNTLPVILSGVAFGTLYIFLIGLTNGEVMRRTRPNQGMRSTAANANRITAVAFFLFSIMFGLVGGPTLAFGVLVGAIFVSWQLYGGFSVTEHVILRRILANDGAIPKNYAHFLDYASSFILLRKVGGGYIFVHRLLLEYFATQAD